MSGLPIERFMTPAPHTIGHDQPLSKAHRIMREHGVRHLPVLQGGRLLGLVSERDLDFIEALSDVDPNEVTVSEAMTPDTYTVGPKAPIEEVARHMAEHKYGSAVVLDGDRVGGIFTTVDALRLLSEVLQERNKKA